MSDISNLNYTTSTGRNVRTNYTMNTYPEDTKYYHKENIVSKNQDGKQVYHTAEQEYSISYDDGGSVIKLDNLLDDLKNERNHPTANTINITEIRPGHTHTTLLQNGGNANYKTKSFQEKNISSSYNVNTLPERNPCIDCSETTKFHDDMILQDQFFSAKNLENHSSSTKKIVSTGSGGLSQDIKEIALVDDILPGPGTKVTTTVRTYTYEIPNNVMIKSLPVDQNDNQIYGDRRNNLIETTNVQSKLYSQNTIPPNKANTVNMPNDMETDRTFYYKNISTNSRNVVCDQHPTDVTISRNVVCNHHPTDVNVSRCVVCERHLTDVTLSRNVVCDHHPTDGTLSRNVVCDHHPTDGNVPRCVVCDHHPTDGNVPRCVVCDHHPTDVHVSRNVVCDHHSTDVNVSKTRYELNKNTKQIDNRFPSNAPILHPSPFPTDEVDRLNKNNIPPKRLDDLMATFENGKPDRNYHESWQDGSKIEQDTSVASPGQPPIEARTLSKNTQGPPVFYPPGQEMFARKEEMSAGYRAQGSAAHASGRYEYGAESSSKSKKSSGAAVVPVCLPLCCAMPCTIM